MVAAARVRAEGCEAAEEASRAEAGPSEAGVSRAAAVPGSVAETLFSVAETLSSVAETPSSVVETPSSVVHASLADDSSTLTASTIRASIWV